MLGWDSIRKFSVRRARGDKPRRKAWRRKRERDKADRDADAIRQWVDADLNWDLVKLLLDGNKGLSLEDAKHTARTITNYV